MKCCKARWANWAKANWANSLLQFVFDTLPLNYIPKIKKRKSAEIYLLGKLGKSKLGKLLFFIVKTMLRIVSIIYIIINNIFILFIINFGKRSVQK